MPAETSNGPRELWVTLTPGGSPVQVWANAAAARHLFFRRRVESFVRRDLVVPTVDEIAEGLYRAENFDGPPLAELGIDGHDYWAMARLVHAWLLSRIEGDGGADHAA